MSSCSLQSPALPLTADGRTHNTDDVSSLLLCAIFVWTVSFCTDYMCQVLFFNKSSVAAFIYLFDFSFTHHPEQSSFCYSAGHYMYDISSAKLFSFSINSTK